MFEIGKKVYFRDENFRAQIGTITHKGEENDAYVMLTVLYNGKSYTVKKSNPTKNMKMK